MKYNPLSRFALLPLVLAQDYGNPSSKSSSPANTPTGTAASSGGAVHTVTVGHDSFVFKPDTLTAAPGDVIQFQIYPTHSVARSTFDNACQPIGGAASVWTGFSSNENTFFTVTVNDTQPIWLYCAAPTHCELGMAMVINPPSGGNNIAAYQSAAKGVGNSGTPVNIAGGVFGKAAASSGSSGSSSSTTAVATAAATSSTGGNGAAGLVVDLMLVGGLLFGSFAFLV